MKTLRCALALCIGLLTLASASARNLDQLTIVPINVTGDVNTEKITVMFNPKEYTITKSTPWKHHDIQGLDSPTLEFTSGEPYRCQFELFFDRYEEGKSVREITDKIEQLAKQPKGGTPDVTVLWGKELWSTKLLSVKIEFVDFLPDGTPVAAIAHTLWSTFFSLEEANGKPSEPIPALLVGPRSKLPTFIDADSVQLLRISEDVVRAKDIRVDEEMGMIPQVVFGEKDPYRLSMDLQFDISKQGTNIKEITTHLNELVGFKGRPPTALLTWGTGLRHTCILESFSLRFTLFLDDGTPVRAVMNTVWKEFSPAEEQLKGNPRH